MRRVLRSEANEDYWDRRWATTGGDADTFADLTIYPVAYAERVMLDRSARAIEIGCGLGRVVKHYSRLGFTIEGIERSGVAVRRMLEADPSLPVREGDVLDLPYEDGTFDVVMAFGLFHNLEHDLDRALAETARVLALGGRFCISMRPDNLEMRLNETYWRWRNRDGRASEKRFHKWLVDETEFAAMLALHGLETGDVHRARNMSLLYRVPILRARTRDETERRSSGYRLNAVGRVLDRALMRWFASQSCNVLVYIGLRAGKEGTTSSSG